MDFLAGPTFTISSSAPPYDGDSQQSDDGDRAVPSYGFVATESSESSSSIGTPTDSENENENDVVSPKRDKDEEEEVQSKLNGLASLDSLEDSLSIKRGLSNHFIGKSKSFTDLSQVSTVKELQKEENPFNKKRRLLIASKWSKRSFYSWSNPKSMPLFPLTEDEDNYEAEKAKEVYSCSSSSSPEEENKQQDQVLMRQQNRVSQFHASHMRLRLRSFKSRSFSLADLQEHDEDQDDEVEDDDS